MNVDGLVSSGGLGGPAILPQSIAKMAQLTQAFPDRAFSGIGGIAEFGHALNYFLLGCGTVQVCTAAMLDHAIGPNVLSSSSPACARRWSATAGRRSRTSAGCGATAWSCTRRSAGPTARRIAAATTPKGMPARTPPGPRADTADHPGTLSALR